MYPESGKYIFVSDVHLGLKVNNPTLREARFVSFLKGIPGNTVAIFLMGDIFDFWFEYKYVVPKGFVRTLGALAELSDKGVKLFFFRGNHDLWTFGYLDGELKIEVVAQPYLIKLGNKSFCLGHGDGLAKGDVGYKLLKWLFYNKILQRLFSGLHPRWAFAMAHAWSSHNRLAKGQRYQFQAQDEPLYKFASEYEKRSDADYFIFGHFHSPGEALTPKGAKFFILGEWIHGCEYLVYDAESDKIEWRSGSVEGHNIST